MEAIGTQGGVTPRGVTPRIPRSEYGGKFGKGYIPTHADYVSVGKTLDKISEIGINGYSVVKELEGVEEAVDLVFEKSGFELADKLSKLVVIGREQKMYSGFVQELINGINLENTVLEGEAYGLLLTREISQILSYFRDRIDENLRRIALIDSLLPKNGD